MREYIYIYIHIFWPKVGDTPRIIQNIHWPYPIFQLAGEKHQLRETLIWAKIAWNFSEDDYDHRRDERRHDDRYEDDRRREGGRLEMGQLVEKNFTYLVKVIRFSEATCL